MVTGDNIETAKAIAKVIYVNNQIYYIILYYTYDIDTTTSKVAGLNNTIFHHVIFIPSIQY